MTYLELLAMLLEEHYEHARLHEEHRTAAANFILATCGLLLGFSVQSDDRSMATTLALAAALLSIYGLLFCRKHYERFRFHEQIARFLRHAIEAKVNDSTGLKTLESYDTIRTAAEIEHFTGDITKRRISERAPKGAPWKLVKNWRLYRFYDLVHVLIALVAIVVAILKIYK